MTAAGHDTGGVTSYRTCGACGADLPADGAACADCGKVACWACGTANDADQAFCRRCGVWLVGREPSTVPATAPSLRPTPTVLSVLPTSRPRAARPVQAAPLRFERAPRRRGRWAATTVAVLLALAAVSSVAALQLRRPERASPAMAALVSTTHGALATATGAPSEPIDATDAAPASTPHVTDAPPAAVGPAAVGPAAVGPASRPTPAKEQRVVERIATPPPARSRTGWVCDDTARVTDARGGRWSVDRISFHAMGGYERVILHLDREGATGSTGTVSGEAFETASIRSHAPAAARPGSGRKTIGIDLGTGIRSGLDLRAFRPKGLQSIRELSIFRGGPASRVLISVASDGCFRMRAPASQAGATTAQLIVDVQR